MYEKCTVVEAIRCYFKLDSFRKASQRTSVPKSTIHLWVSRLKATANRKKKSRQILRRRRYKRCELYNQVVAELTSQPFHTVRSLKVALRTSLSAASVSRAIRDVGFSRKKVSWRVSPSSMDTEKVQFKNVLQKHIQSGRVAVAVDETGFTSCQLPSTGYCKVGHRLKAFKQQNTRIHLSCVMAIDTTGGVSYRIQRGAYNGQSFQMFIKTLRRYPRGSAIIMDNIAFHKSATVRRLCNCRGLRVMFTPPYSPECNPIEHMFSAIKYHLGNILLNTASHNVQSFEEAVQLAIDAARCSSRVSSLFSLPDVGS